MSSDRVYTSVLVDRNCDCLCVVEVGRFDTDNAGAIALNEIVHAFQLRAYYANDNPGAHSSKQHFRLPHDSAALTMFLAGGSHP